MRKFFDIGNFAKEPYPHSQEIKWFCEANVTEDWSPGLALGWPSAVAQRLALMRG